MLNYLKWIAVGIFAGLMILITSSLFHQEIGQFKNLVTRPVIYNNKTMTIGRSFNSIALDPAITIDQESSKVTVNIYENLVAYNRDKIVPSLARSWTVSEDGLTWQFTLQENVFFHDGTSFNADAVTFNFNRWMDKTSPYHAGNFQYWNIVFGDTPCIIKSVQTLSDYIVEIKLCKPYSPFLSTLTMPAFGIASPEAVMKYNEDFKYKPVGTGPYVLKSWDETGEIILEDNVNYWRTRANIKTLVFKPIPESADRVALLKNGDIQFLDNLTASEVSALEDVENIDLVRRPFTNVGYLAMNLDNLFLSNRGVRLSIASAVKRNLETKLELNSFSRNTDSFIPPGIWGSNNNINHRFIHPDTSKVVFNAYDPSDRELRLLVMKEPRPYFPEPMKIAEQVKSSLEPLGVTVTIIEQPWDVFLETIQNGEYDLLLMGWIADVMDPDNFLYTFFSSENIEDGAISNYARYKNKRVDLLLTLARQAANHSFRESLYREAQELIISDTPAIPLVNTMTIVGVNKAVDGFVPTINGLESLNTLDYEMEQ